LYGCEDLEVKEEKDRPDEDWFSLVDAGKERSFRRPLTWKRKIKEKSYFLKKRMKTKF
jgi:hypothetical protein